MDSSYRLVTIPASHYCEKARWALDRLATGAVVVVYLCFIAIGGAMQLHGVAIDDYILQLGYQLDGKGFRQKGGDGVGGGHVTL